MKNFFYLLFAFLLLNCTQEQPTPIEEPVILADQILNISSTFIGEVASYSYDESLLVDVTNDTLSIVVQDETLNFILAINDIVDSSVSPVLLKMPRDFSSGPSGLPKDCTYYPCDNFVVSFTEMDFNQYGTIEGSIFGAHESNPEEVQVFGDFKLQVD